MKKKLPFRSHLIIIIVKGYCHLTFTLLEFCVIGIYYKPSSFIIKLLFSCKKNSRNHQSLFFNGTLVPKVNEQKTVGLVLDSKLSFEKHLNDHKGKKGLES